jgi:rhodanese-related sulfurtransferase
MQDLAKFASANLFLVTGLIASALAVLFYELRLKARDIGSLSAAMAVRVINDGAAVVDLRSAELFAAGHIVDAKHIPEATLLAEPAVLDGNLKGTLLVCDTGSRSASVAAQLRKRAAQNVFTINGGLAAWQQENLPVVRD